MASFDEALQDGSQTHFLNHDTSARVAQIILSTAEYKCRDSFGARFWREGKPEHTSFEIDLKSGDRRVTLKFRWHGQLCNGDRLPEFSAPQDRLIYFPRHEYRLAPDSLGLELIGMDDQLIVPPVTVRITYSAMATTTANVSERPITKEKPWWRFW